MNQIDWKKAPNGATHYKPENGLFYRASFGRLDFFIHGGWQESGCGLSYVKNLVEIPVTWDGVGLPPVGTVCEFHKPDGHSTGWHERLKSGAKVEVIAHYSPVPGGIVAVFAFPASGGREVERAAARCFRPIRTPEQLAPETRERAIRSMTNICPYPGSECTRIDCEALYDAGLRFPEGGDV